MSYLFEYFDLNKRANDVRAKDEGVDIIDKLVSSNKSEIKLKIPDPVAIQETENPSYRQTSSTTSPAFSLALNQDEDHLYNDMATYWEDNDRRNYDDRRSQERRYLSLIEKFQSITSTFPIPWWQQATLYSGIIIGATISSTVIEHQAGTDYLFEISLPFVILSSMMAIIISPVAFEKLSMRFTGSFFARFFLFIQNGAFWYVLVSAFYFTLIQLIKIALQ